MRRLLPCVLFLHLTAAPLAAQTLREQFDSLFHFGNCAELLCLPVDPAQHGRHFIPALQQGSRNVTDFVTNSIGFTVSNIPISAATSGAVWSRSETGLPVRTATSAGPIFAERAQTLGRNHVLFGVNLTNYNFTTIRGIPLSGLVFDFTHIDVDSNGLGSPDFEGDVLEVRTDLDVNLFAVTGVLTYGLLDAVDIGVAVPMVHTSLKGTSLATIIPAEQQTPHRFGTDANPSLTASASTDGSATGIGDIAARVKARLMQSPSAGVAVVGEVRFPTGKEEDLLGSGEYSARGLGIISARLGTFTPHLDLGYNYRGGSPERCSARDGRFRSVDRELGNIRSRRDLPIPGRNLQAATARPGGDQRAARKRDLSSHRGAEQHPKHQGQRRPGFLRVQVHRAEWLHCGDECVDPGASGVAAARRRLDRWIGVHLLG